MDKPAIIVAGMGRCGSSLTMQMLHRAGVPCIGRFPDFEDERLMRGNFDAGFFAGITGSAVKVLEPMHHALPPLSNHIVIWLNRDPKDQAASMAKLLHRSFGVPINRSGRTGLEKSLRRDRKPNQNALRHAPMIEVEFADLIRPDSRFGAQAIATFLNAYGWRSIDVNTMTEAIITRTPQCLNGTLLEEVLLLKAEMAA